MPIVVRLMARLLLDSVTVVIVLLVVMTIALLDFSPLVNVLLCVYVRLHQYERLLHTPLSSEKQMFTKIDFKKKAI